MTSAEPRLTLFADSLFSKWGFNDGDCPDWLLDYCDEHDLPYPEDWHTALCTLVRGHLVPALAPMVKVVEIGTNHNPIRAQSVGGVEVSDDVIYGDAESPRVTPDWVEVPLSIVLRTCGLEVVAGEVARG